MPGVLQQAGQINRTDAGLARGRDWSRSDAERVARRRYEYAVAAREYGEGPGSPAHARLQAWRAASRVADRRADRVRSARKRYEEASRQWWVQDRGVSVRFPIQDPKVGRDYNAWVRAARELERLENGLGWGEGKEPADEDDRVQSGSTEHRVREYVKDDGERVRPHLARNPRRRR